MAAISIRSVINGSSYRRKNGLIKRGINMARNRGPWRQTWRQRQRNGGGNIAGRKRNVASVINLAYRRRLTWHEIERKIGRNISGEAACYR